MEFFIALQIFGLIGAISLISAITYLFTAIGKNATPLNVEEATPKPGDSAFIHNIATLSGGHTHYFDPEKCEVIGSNTTYYAQLLSDVEHAKSSISLVTYVWKYDEVSKDFFDALIRAVKRGVKVRLLFDAHGSTVKKYTIKELRKEGVEIKLLRPFEIGKLSLYSSRIHERAFIIDGKVGYFGGSAISKRWFKDQSKKDFTYTDIMYRVTGEPVAAIAAAFGELWSSYAGVTPQSLYVPEENKNKQKPHNAFALVHKPRVDISPLTYALFYACVAARNEIVIVNPYFIPGLTLKKVLVDKVRSGVKVKIITQGTNEVRLVRAAGRSYYHRLLEEGVEIYEYTKPHLHTKLLMIDGVFSIGGSANFDIRSQRINHEFIIGVQSEEFAAKNQAIIDSYQPYLNQITKEDWDQQPFYKHWFYLLMRALSEQF